MSPFMEIPHEEILYMRNDLTVALLALDVLSQEEELSAETRRLVDVALARQVRAIRRLPVNEHPDRFDESN